MRGVGGGSRGRGPPGTPDPIFSRGPPGARNPGTPGGEGGVWSKARGRVFERDRRLRPPRQIGAPPTAPAPSSAIRDLGYRVTQTDRDLLRGVSASPGRGRGPVRMVNGPADFERFQRGDVLVCRSTTVS